MSFPETRAMLPPVDVEVEHDPSKSKSKATATETIPSLKVPRSSWSLANPTHLSSREVAVRLP
jgi:hypothetical protein